MKTCGRSGVLAPTFLTWALDGSERSASRSCRFNPGERAPGTHWLGGWVGPRFDLDAAEKRKNLHCRDSNPGLSVCSPSVLKIYSPFRTTFVCTLSIDSIWVLYWHDIFKNTKALRKDTGVRNWPSWSTFRTWSDCSFQLEKKAWTSVMKVASVRAKSLCESHGVDLC
jgi:hypothetical protein